MTGLDLETFLQLLRADVGAWFTLALVVFVLAVMAWTSWGSRRALRKCLVLSIAAHVGLVLYGSTIPVVQMVLAGERSTSEDEPTPVHVQLAADPDSSASAYGGPNGGNGKRTRNVAAWDRANDKATLVDPSIRPMTPRVDVSQPAPAPPDLAKLNTETASPEINPPPPSPVSVDNKAEAPTATAAATDSSEVAAPTARRTTETPVDRLDSETRARPAMATNLPELTAPAASSTPGSSPSLTAAPTLGALTNRPAGDAPGPSSERMNPAAGGVVQGDPSEIKTAPRTAATPSDNGAGFTGSGRVRVPQTGTRETGAPNTSLAMNLPATTATPRGVAPSATNPKPTLAPANRAMTPTTPIASPTATPVEASTAKAEPRRPAIEGPRDTLAESNARRTQRPARETQALALNTERRPDLAMPRATPSGLPGLPAIAGASGLTRPAGDIPQVYRSRLDPNRFALALRDGATRESEQAVERALEWLRKHQDADGRWDGGSAKLRDGAVLRGEDDFTSHCPAGDVCFGECFYWEADTALTGLALLAYLGSGYTHTDGQYADTVARGLEFLRHAQRPDGDLRGDSKAVGMYCHAMATLALCEAYALTGDPKLKAPVEKAVSFLVSARATDRQAWRYSPGAATGDTSILGWVVMVLKSAQENGLPMSADTRQGILKWLARVSTGAARGLAFYQPGEMPTASMTAEAWVCRQFLGVGGPGTASNEAADYLLRNSPDRSEYNLYTWYYGTLAMYQHGGTPWVAWNTQVRDQLVKRQRLNGHAAGSWDPDSSKFGSLGGRIYSTALATLSLEVYYRYLRLYESPPTTSSAPSSVSRPPVAAPPSIVSEPTNLPR